MSKEDCRNEIHPDQQRQALNEYRQLEQNERILDSKCAPEDRHQVVGGAEIVQLGDVALHTIRFIWQPARNPLTGIETAVEIMKVFEEQRGVMHRRDRRSKVG